MAPIAHLLLAPAVILTLLLLPLAVATSPLTGAESAGVGMPLLWVCGPRWVLLALLLVVVVRREGFRWVSPSRTLAGMGVLGGHALVGFFSLLSLVSLTKGSGLAYGGVLLFSLGLPVLLMLYSAWALRRHPTNPG